LIFRVGWLAGCVPQSNLTEIGNPAFVGFCDPASVAG
jgi:hypothetical protein